MPRARKDRRRRAQASHPVPPDRVCQIVSAPGELPCPLRGYGDSPARLCSAHREEHTKLYRAYKILSDETERLGALVDDEPDWQDHAHWVKNKVDAAIATREQYVRAIDAELEGRDAHRRKFIAEQDDGHAQWLRRLQDKRSDSCRMLEQLRRCRDVLIQEAIRAEARAKERQNEAERRVNAYWDRIRRAEAQRAKIRKEEERARLETEVMQRKEREAARRKEEIARLQARQDEDARRAEAERARQTARQAADTERKRQATLTIQQQEAYRPVPTRLPSANGTQPLLPTNTRQPTPAARPVSYHSRGAVDVEAQRMYYEDGRSSCGGFGNALLVLVVVGACTFYALVRWVG
ncbi:hypothetical protein C8Q79DRAFT_929904 [Trametes meyenii]|nr:hypothetical protein C8Q79DRAFT_929904 [Trametes meyenii]